MACQRRPRTGIGGRTSYSDSYRRESRPNPATLDIDIADTRKRQIRLVGTFPEAWPVLGEVTENPCVRRGYPERMSITDVSHGLFRRFAYRRFVGRCMDDSIVRFWVLSSEKIPYVDEP